VTCKLTIDGLGSHSGLGEEWADNENAGTSAEAQAFKRACSCSVWDGTSTIWVVAGSTWMIGSSRYPDPGYPIGHFRSATGDTKPQNGNGHTGTNGHVQHNSVDRVDLPTLKALVKSLVNRWGFGLARSVTKAIAATEDPEQIADAAALSALSQSWKTHFVVWNGFVQPPESSGRRVSRNFASR